MTEKVDTSVPLVQFTVFHQGGLVLYNYENYRNTVKPKSDPVNELVQGVLLHPENPTSFDTGLFTMRWLLDNTSDLVFVCVYFAELRVKFSWMGDFLVAIKKIFCKHFDDLISQNKWQRLTQAQWRKFENDYVKCVKRFATKKATQTQRVPMKFEQTGKAKEMVKFGRDDLKTEKAESETPQSKKDKLAKLGSRKGKKAPGGFRGKKKKKGDEKEKKPKEKQKRQWSAHMAKKNVDKRDLDSITITSDAQKKRKEEAEDEEDDEVEYNTPTGKADFNETDSEDDGELEEDLTRQGGWFTNAFASLTGTKKLTEEDLTPSIDAMKDHLIGKNVATGIADAICASIIQELKGQTCGTFTTIYRKVTEVTRRALTRILTPGRRNILTEIGQAKAAGRPYTVAFVGVNGVGKSTSLSKLAYYFGRHNLKVSMCACDTFRSGAVEQLRTHATALKVRLFAQGYNKDPAEVARHGIRKAFEEKDDVVLIDTAGRMQGNVALMRELAKLIQNNRPDLVLFVGEALVGNDGADQLMLFNKALEEHSRVANPRLIDGIVLTKFDTVDDKVGAAISMCHVSQKPIMFVGVGQNYPDMKRLNVSTLLAKLFQ